MIDLPAPVSPVSTLKAGAQLNVEAFNGGEVGDAKESEHWLYPKLHPSELRLVHEMVRD